MQQQMQKWEHLFLSAYLVGMVTKHWEMPLGPGKKLNSWEEIMAFVQQLGDQGWQLVSTTSIIYPGNVQIEYSLAFKRPKW